MIVALAGKIHSGKGTISSYLADKYGFKRVGFSDSFKKIAKDIGWDGQKDEAGRRLLQNLGSALRDHLGHDVLVNPITTQIQDGSNWVIDDMRMTQEAEAVKKIGAVLIKVERSNYTRDGAVDQHITETDLDHYQFDFVIQNNATVKDLYLQVDELLQKLAFSPDK